MNTTAIVDNIDTAQYGLITGTGVPLPSTGHAVVVGSFYVQNKKLYVGTTIGGADNDSGKIQLLKVDGTGNGTDVVVKNVR